MRIGDLFFRILAEASGFEADVVKKVDAAGVAAEKSLGARLGSALKTKGIRAFAGAASAAFAIMGKGAIELEEIQARITAETGAGADEAKAAAKAVNAAAGRERLALEDVADAAVKVRTDLGAQGEAADDLTAKFARYARVTRQGPGAAVSDFDDILDAWNLTADKSGEIMDKLIVSHERYGGTITDDQKALAAIAPQLKAFNLGIDDGIALLDLFKESGLDAAAIPRALNSAIQKLDGRPLGDFVKELASIEDPGERARRAIEIFGSRAGVSLANAIKPGMDSLDDLGITAEDAAGALDKAADALDSTPWATFKRLASEAQAALRDFGGELGPAVTGLASLAGLAGAIGLDDFAKRFAGKMLEAGKAGGEALIDGVGTATGAAGTVIGNLVADVLDPTKALLGNPIRRVATAAGALWSATFGAAARVAGVITDMFLALPGVTAVRNAVIAAAQEIGTLAGTRLATAIKVATVIGLLALGKDVLDAFNDQVADFKERARQLGEDATRAIIEGSADELKRRRAEIAATLAELYAPKNVGFDFDPLRPFRTLFESGEIDKLRGQINALDAAIASLGGNGDVDVSVGVKLGPPKPDAIASGAIAGRTLGQAAGEQLKRWMGMSWSEATIAIGHDARLKGAQIALDLASGLRSARGNIEGALDQLREDMQHRLTPKKEVGVRIAQLFSKNLAKGLKDADPVIKAQAEGTRGLIEDQLIETIKAGGEAGEKIQKELQKKLHSKDPDVRDQAKRTKQLVDAALKAQPPKTPGEVIGDDLAKDLAKYGPVLGRIMYNLGKMLVRELRAGVQGSGFDGGSVSSGTSRPKVGGPQEYDTGTWYVPRTGPAVVHQAEIVVPAPSASAIRAGDAVLGTRAATAEAGASAGDTFNLYLPDARHTDPWAVLDRLPRYAKVAKAETSGDGWRAA